jgi:hypothetical protein
MSTTAGHVTEGVFLVHECAGVDKDLCNPYQEWLAGLYEKAKERGKVAFVIINTIDCSKYVKEIYGRCCGRTMIPAAPENINTLEQRLQDLEYKVSPFVKQNCAIFVMHDKE